jgi:small-conductance mechanosensitive channel
MDDSSFIIRCKFTAIPGNQFIMRREAFVRIQRAFEQKGIKFAPRRVIVETVTSESPAEVTATAGAAAVAAPEGPQDQGKDEPG